MEPEATPALSDIPKLEPPSSIKLLSRPTLPTVMTGLPVSSLVQPAKFISEPSNSFSQKRRVLQWKISTPASTSGVKNAFNSSGVWAKRAL